jgi:hypothetical protein
MVIRRALASAAILLAFGCARMAPAAGGAAAVAPTSYGDAALRSFTPDIAANESGGECNFWRTTSGTIAANTIAYFPNRANTKMTVQITFDSTGRLTNYYETRAPVNYPALPPGTAPAARDSLFKSARDAHRSTSIILNFAMDQAILRNFGAGQPENSVMAKVNDVESLPGLGPVKDRLARVRNLCGV